MVERMRAIVMGAAVLVTACGAASQVGQPCDPSPDKCVQIDAETWALQSCVARKWKLYDCPGPRRCATTTSASAGVSTFCDQTVVSLGAECPFKSSTSWCGPDGGTARECSGLTITERACPGGCTGNAECR